MKTGAFFYVSALAFAQATLLTLSFAYANSKVSSGTRLVAIKTSTHLNSFKEARQLGVASAADAAVL